MQYLIRNILSRTPAWREFSPHEHGWCPSNSRKQGYHLRNCSLNLLYAKFDCQIRKMKLLHVGYSWSDAAYGFSFAAIWMLSSWSEVMVSGSSFLGITPNVASLWYSFNKYGTFTFCSWHARLGIACFGTSASTQFKFVIARNKHASAVLQSREADPKCFAKFTQRKFFIYYIFKVN